MSALASTAIRRSAWRLLPLLVFMYFLSYLDRVNVSFAALTMNGDLGFTATIYGLGAGLFFFGYFLGEVPSNLALERVGARLWLARIMITWGLVSAAMALVAGAKSFYLVRFLLGLSEAGLYPGVLLYLTYWFPERMRTRMVGIFLTAAPLSTLVGAPISVWLLKFDGLYGLHGWQWMFILEGLPTALFGICVLFVLPDRPDKVEWLAPAERDWLNAELASENKVRAASNITGVVQTLLNPGVLGYCLAYFFLTTALYGVGFWMPQVVRSLGFSIGAVGWIVAMPSLITAVLIIPWSIHSDNRDERLWHTILPLMVAAAGLLLAAYGSTDVLKIAGFTLGSIGVFCAIPPFWALPISRLAGTAAATGIAIIGGVGNLGGYFGPLTLGILKDATGGYSFGLAMLSACAAACFCLVFALSRATQRQRALGAAKQLPEPP